MIEEISAEEKKDAIKRIKRIRDAFKDTRKTAEHVYDDAVQKGDVKIQFEIQEQIEKIKKEEAALQNIILELGTI